MIESLASHLRALRKSRNLSIENVADEIGWSKSAISYWERGRSHPCDDAIICLEGYYGVRLRDRHYYTAFRADNDAMRVLRGMGNNLDAMRRGLSVLGIAVEAVAELEM